MKVTCYIQMYTCIIVCVFMGSKGKKAGHKRGCTVECVFLKLDFAHGHLWLKSKHSIIPLTNVL